ncbi:MAG: DUF456 domain-containing protein [Opitutaceae bacterium]|nr:DUF456 domain-containing protein [Opitutaceae bacterium]
MHRNFLQPRGFASCLVGVDYLVWSLTVSLLLIGLIGCIVPLLPGTTFILIGAVLHKLLLPDSMGWSVVAWVSALWFLSIVADFIGVMIGAKLFGGGKWGMTGATGGAFVGMFFSLPALLLGTFLGAVVAEKYGAKRTDRESLKAGVGATVGFFISTAARLFCAVAMIALIIAAATDWFSAMPTP